MPSQDLYEFDEFKGSNQLTLIFNQRQKFINIGVVLKDLNINLEPQYFIKVGEIFEIKQEKQSKKNNTSLQIKNEMKISVDLKNILIYAITPNSQRVLAVSGEISVIIDTHEQNEFQDDYLKTNFALENLELFLCEKNQLFKSKLNKNERQKVVKRSLVLPFSMFFSLKIGKQNDQQMINIDSTLEKVAVRISYKDFVRIQKTLEHQNSLIQGQSQQSAIQQKQQNQQDLKFISVNFKGLQLILINDYQQQLLPLFELKFKQIQLFVNQSVEQLILRSSLAAMVSYFNVNNSKWEPIIERVMIDLEVDKKLVKNNNENEQNENQDYGNKVLLRTNDLNVNISSHLIKLMQTISHQLTHPIEQNEQDKVQYVSPYQFCNYSGYPIEIYRQKEKIITIDNGQHVNYEIIDMNNLNFQLHQQVEPDIEDIFKDQNDLKIQTICIKILQSYIQDINFDRLRTTKYVLQNSFRPQDLNYLICSVEIQEQRKVLIFKSNIKILSEVDFDVLMHLHSDQQFENNGSYNSHSIESSQKILFHEQQELNNHFMNIQAWSTKYVPFNLTTKQFSFVSSDKQNKSETYSFSEIIKQKYTQIQFNNIYFFMQISSNKEEILIKIIPVFKVINYLPMNVDIELNSGNKKSTKFLEQTQSAIYNIFDLQDEIEMSIKIDKFNQQHVKIQKNLKNKNQKIFLEDTYNLTTQINIFYKMHDIFYQQAPQEFILYTDAFIQNDTSFDMKIYGHQKNDDYKELIAGQSENSNSQILILSNQEYIYFSNKQIDSELSQKLRITGIGNSNSEFKTSNNEVCEIISSSILKCIDEENRLFTRKITLLPKYMIVNLTSQDIKLKQFDSSGVFNLKKNSRIPYLWPDQQSKRLIQLTFDERQYEFSGILDISQVKTRYITIRKKYNSSEQKYFKVSIIQENSIFYIFLEEKIGFELSNQLNDLQIQYYQVKHQDQKTSLQYNETKCFGWDYPEEQCQLQINFEQNGTSLGNYKISFDQNKSFQLKNNIKVDVIITTDGNIRKITFCRKNEVVKVAEEKKTQIFNQYLLLIQSLGISVIQNDNDKKELFYILLQNVALCNYVSQEQQKIQLKVKYFNIDNNSQYLLQSPVLLTPTNYKKVRFDDFEYFMNMTVDIDLTQKKILLLESIKLNMLPITLKIDANLIATIVEFSNSLQQNNFQKVYLTKSTHNYNEFTLQQLSDKKAVIINEVLINVLKINLSFKTIENDQSSNTFLLIDSIFKALKFSLSNIDDAPLSLDGIKLYDCYDIADNVVKKIYVHYIGCVFKQALRLIGSVELIGNPLGFLSNIETGIQDLFEKPLEGFIKGPLEGSVGIFMGAQSLVNKTVAGTFNSLNMIIGSIGSGVSQLSLDNDYLNQRQQMRNIKVTNFGQGINQAGKSIFEGIEQGLLGIITKPMEGAQKQGILGFLKGSIQGVIGAIIKPITGALDAGSMTSQAIKVSAMGDAGPRIVREREIRVFYDIDQYFKNYNAEDAKCHKCLQVIKRGRFSHNNFLCQIPIDIENQVYLVITIQSVLLISTKQKIRIWDIYANNILTVDLRLDGISLNLKYPTKKQPNKYESIRIKDIKLKEWTIKQIDYLIDLNK